MISSGFGYRSDPINGTRRCTPASISAAARLADPRRGRRQG
jgi:hypothetical protein